ncbi:hypothetical protein AAZX31_11G156300 [Glycine max]|uniref:GIR1-like zinc ribbon domain-containing protein n=2 Tax=Glycine subgen. Soja TaxID=1462606 RepID=I1LKN5_SOYBN|nr:protein GL2-INTERACTING REPRESSOR 1 [Glycine max]XP_028186477.1 uncharacterized protein LOC114373138 [Glycine soja]KAG4994428.1 hypothetical protein JHK86_031255 [Glycine max]KAG5124423.1 hypothetical protein JHK82_031160 [Glycine max]KAH1159171.1 hypothetical protein GYH30_031074 [Glycine max]KAH1225121.1 hypothetical protein GmHk_11G032097 [Glycine max]KHN19910.1 hypothetical protein glysoja_032390 [Glycine soja]|eukprot:XP_003538098.1 uncharacterized protein LOC100775986 [Glycine max]
MSKRVRSPRLELRLNLSPPRAAATSIISSSELSPTESSMSSPVSVQSLESSCVSSEAEETRAMLLVGCPRCLMYVMLSEVDPKCPKCKSTVLLDFLNNEENNNTKKSSSE